MSVCPPGYQWHHSLEKQRLPLLSLIDSLGSALRVAAQPDLLRRASAFLRSQRAPGNNPVSLPFPANSVYLLTLREAMKAALTDKQSYDAAFMSGLDFFLSLSLLAFLPPSRMSQSVVSPFFPSHGPCWHRNPSLLTLGRMGHVGGHYYSWGSVIHSVTRCQQEVSVCTAAPLTLFISQGWLMRSTRLIPPLEQQWL